ncbi:hypothetical protein V6N11_009952 [Hibiscus sabdariffa]|uniref:Reverse transcriptase zinc-binding domain-containing protein n=1 Tax=Hibiscus sabdariffa TaxID=183260 RepID=A0ABR2PD65_9ROSI
MVAGEDWDWIRLQGWLPASILEKLAACPIPKSSLGDDIPGWRWKDNRCFTVGSAYEYLMTEEARHSSSHWKRIWKLRVPHRVRVFMWLVAHRKLLTNDERVRRHLAIFAECSICGAGVEDIDHVLRRCTKARALWMQVLGDAHIGGEFFTQPFEVFGLTEQACATEVRNPLRWCGPATGWVKLNVDAAVNSADGSASVGGDWEVVVRWVSRERNGVVDSLAAMGRLHGRSGVGFRLPPGGVLDRLDKERIEWLAAERRTALPSSRVRDSGIVFDPGG